MKTSLVVAVVLALAACGGATDVPSAAVGSWTNVNGSDVTICPGPGGGSLTTNYPAGSLTLTFGHAAAGQLAEVDGADCSWTWDISDPDDATMVGGQPCDATSSNGDVYAFNDADSLAVSGDTMVETLSGSVTSPQFPGQMCTFSGSITLQRVRP